jgi:hypothetical protein
VPFVSEWFSDFPKDVKFPQTYRKCLGRQMAAAYDHYLHLPVRLDWDWVTARHKAITYDRDRQVVR